jgi:hypothetical protein
MKHTPSQANCLFCHEVCDIQNKSVCYEGCECTLPYHTSCIKQWFTKQGYECPLCRKAVQVVEGDKDESFKNECAAYTIFTIVINLFMACFL